METVKVVVILAILFGLWAWASNEDYKDAKEMEKINTEIRAKEIVHTLFQRKDTKRIICSS